jgi:hypothetical protein
MAHKAVPGFRKGMEESLAEHGMGHTSIMNAHELENTELEAFHKASVGVMGFQMAEGFAIECINFRDGGLGFGEAGDEFVEITGGEQAAVIVCGRAGRGLGFKFTQGVQLGTPAGGKGQMPGAKDVDFSKKGLAGAACAFGQGAEDAMIMGQPDDDEAGFGIRKAMDDDAFIMNRRHERVWG